MVKEAVPDLRCRGHFVVEMLRSRESDLVGNAFGFLVVEYTAWLVMRHLTHDASNGERVSCGNDPEVWELEGAEDLMSWAGGFLGRVGGYGLVSLGWRRVVVMLRGVVAAAGGGDVGVVGELVDVALSDVPEGVRVAAARGAVLAGWGVCDVDGVVGQLSRLCGSGVVSAVAYQGRWDRFSSEYRGVVLGAVGVAEGEFLSFRPPPGDLM